MRTNRRGLNSAFTDRRSTGPLLRTQREHRVDQRGAAGGDVAGEQSYSGEQERHERERRRIMRRNTVQVAREQAGGAVSSYKSNAETEPDKAESLAHDHANNVARLGAERHAHADLLGALRD